MIMEKYTDANINNEIKVNWIVLENTIKQEYADYGEEQDEECEVCKEKIFQYIDLDSKREMEYCNNPKCKIYLEVIN